MDKKKTLTPLSPQTGIKKQMQKLMQKLMQKQIQKLEENVFLLHTFYTNS